MLKAAAALCQPRQHIFFERKALLFHISEYKLFEAVIRQILTHHKIEELVGYWGLAVQIVNVKVLKRLTSIHTFELILELVEDPRYRSWMNLIIVDFKTLTIKVLNCFYVNIFFRKCVVVKIVDFHNELVLGRGMVIGLHFFQRSKATNSYSLREQWVLGSLSILGCY